MTRLWLLTLAAGLSLAGTVPAQSAAWKFSCPKTGVLTYRVEQITSATEVIGGNKTATTTRLNLVKRWKCLGPDKGREGLRWQLTLVSLRIETTKANGEVLRFDSENPGKGTPELRGQLAKLVGNPLALVRLAPSGKVIEVIESKHGPASRFESEPPFVLVMPGAAPKAGQAWQRSYQMTLAPPQGAGEKFDAVQKYVCKEIKEGKATIGLTTVIKHLPESLLDQVPLMQMQPAGEVVYDIPAGRMESARLKIDKELKDHQGKGSSYRFQSLYSERLVMGK
jgi:hypothetical protein